eukprot:183570-Hanusia_phi.AAC.1
MMLVTKGKTCCASMSEGRRREHQAEQGVKQRTRKDQHNKRRRTEAEARKGLPVALACELALLCLHMCRRRAAQAPEDCMCCSDQESKRREEQAAEIRRRGMGEGSMGTRERERRRGKGRARAAHLQQQHVARSISVQKVAEAV